MSSHRSFLRPLGLVIATALAVPLALAASLPASAAVPTVGLGVLGDYSVLGGAAVTNTGPSVLNGSLGVSPGTAISGFDIPGGPGVVAGGTRYTPPAADPARAAAGTAYLDAAGRSGTPIADVELGGKTLVAGVYTAGSTGTFGLTSTLTLLGDADDVWIFQTDSTLITASASSVVLSGGAQACNVFWKVGTSATLGASSSFAGTVLAAASITLGDDVAVVGRLIAGTGAVTLINDVVTRPLCATPDGTAATEAAAAAALAAQLAEAARIAAENTATAAAAAASAAAAAQATATEATAAAITAREAADAAVAYAASLVPSSPEADAAAATAVELAEAAEAAAEAAQVAADTAVAASEAAAAVAAAALARSDELTAAALTAQAVSDAAAAAEAQAAAASARALAATGFAESPLYGVGALGMLIAGLALVMIRRRRGAAAR